MPNNHATLRALTCDSLESFTHACIDSRRLATDVPLLQGLRAWPITKLSGINDSIECVSAAKGDTLVLACEGYAALCAGILSQALNFPLFVAPRDQLLERAREHSSNKPVALVMLKEDADDALLFGLADDFQAALLSHRPWEQLPRCTIVTARNVAALSWLVFKLIVHAKLTSSGSASGRLVSVTPHESLCLISEVSLTDAGACTTTREADLTATLAALAQPADVLAYSTHGEDACASGGGGIVLCGLSVAHDADTPFNGTALACGLGHPCPRGPRPTRLSTIAAPMLMLHACNSLRLGDGSLASDFNLGLEFLDGLGTAYVGALFTGTGPLSANAFMAAIASGMKFAEAVAMANAFVAQARLDRCLFMGVGLPQDSARVPKKTVAATPFELRMSEAARMQGEGAHLISICLTDPGIIDCARDSRLSFSIERGPTKDSIYWWYRLESAAPLQVRAFFFRFPAPVDELCFTPVDGQALHERCLDALRSLERWIELWRLTALSRSHSRLFRQLTELHSDAREVLAEHLARLRFDGAAPGRFGDIHSRLTAAAVDAGVAALQTFTPRLTGSFWLTAVLAGEYRFDRALSAPCSYCSRLVVRKVVRHALSGEKRVTDICPRCGIVADILEQGSIASLIIEAPSLTPVGTPFEGRVRIIPAPGVSPTTEVILAVRLCTHGLREVPPTQAQTRAALNGDSVEMPFRFSVPADLPPHQYRIKVLTITPDSMGFASRLLAVR